MAQLENIEAIEARLWRAADLLRSGSELASNEYFKRRKYHAKIKRPQGANPAKDKNDTNRTQDPEFGDS